MRRYALVPVLAAFAVLAAPVAMASAEILTPLQSGPGSAKKKRGAAEGETLRPVQPNAGTQGDAETNPPRRPAPRTEDCAKCVFF